MLSDLIVNVHRKETPNVGDLRSAPLEHFSVSSKQRIIEVSGWKREDAEKRRRWEDVFFAAKGVVYGGGGLMEFEKYESSLEFVSRNKTKCVIRRWTQQPEGLLVKSKAAIQDGLFGIRSSWLS